MGIVFSTFMSVCPFGMAQEPLPKRDSDQWRQHYQKLYKRLESHGWRRSIRGRVVDSHGRPMPDVRVLAKPSGQAVGMPEESGAVTDKDGRYRIRGLSVQSVYFVSFENEGHPLVADRIQRVDFSPSTPTTPIDFQVSPGPIIRVRVRDIETGAPIGGVGVWARPPNFPLDQERRQATTNAQGIAEYRSSLTSGSLRIEKDSTDQSYGPVPGTPRIIEFRKGSFHKFTFDLFLLRDGQTRRTFSLRGVVLDPQGHSVSGAMVWFAEGRRTSWDTCFVGQVVRTDRQGGFVLPIQRRYEAEPTQPFVVLASQGTRAGFRELAAKDGWSSIRIEIGALRTGTAYGRVIDERGSPLKGVPIDARSAFGTTAGPDDVQGSVRTGSDGRFTIPGLWPTAWYSFSTGSKYPGGFLRPSSVRLGYGGISVDPIREGEAKSLGWIVVHHADSTIQGTIVDENGKPFPDRLFLSLKGAQNDTSAYVDTQGRFKIDGIVDEPMTLRVFREVNGVMNMGDENLTQLLKLRVRPNEQALRLVVKRPNSKPRD